MRTSRFSIQFMVWAAQIAWQLPFARSSSPRHKTHTVAELRVLTQCVGEFDLSATQHKQPIRYGRTACPRTQYTQHVCHARGCATCSVHCTTYLQSARLGVSYYHTENMYIIYKTYFLQMRFSNHRCCYTKKNSSGKISRLGCAAAMTPPGKTQQDAFCLPPPRHIYVYIDSAANVFALSRAKEAHHMPDPKHTHNRSMD